MWFKMAGWIREGARIVKNESLIAEMCTVRYSNDNASNKLQLESKDSLKDRLGFSPDIADACALTWGFPVYADPDDRHNLEAAAKMGIMGGRGNGAGGNNRSLYNPLSGSR